MRRLSVLFALLAGCGLLEPDEHWCSKTYYWSVTDSVVAVDSVGTWYAAEPKPDSVVIEWSVDGECPESGATLTR